jgi:hypothetical protein
MYVQGAQVQAIPISRIMMVWLWHEADCVTAVNFTLSLEGSMQLLHTLHKSNLHTCMCLLYCGEGACVDTMHVSVLW